MNGPGILKYFNDDIICGYWKASKLHGFIYKYDALNNLWIHFEYNAGVLIKNIEEKTVSSSTLSGFFH